MSSADGSAQKATHAGGLVVRTDGAAPRYLLVQALSNASHWVLPKGTIEPEETAHEAAVREVREETGVTATVVRPLEEIEFTFGGKQVVVAYFLMNYVSGGFANEERATRWCRYDEAMSLLTFADARKVLEKVERQDPAG